MGKNRVILPHDGKDALRFETARRYLDDAQYLLDAGRLESAVSRAYYAAYQAMWAVLEEPPRGGQWRHLGIISHFVRGYWFAPHHPQTGPGLLEHLRLPLHRLYQFRINADYDLIPLDASRAEEGVEIATRTIAEIAQKNQGDNP